MSNFAFSLDDLLDDSGAGVSREIHKNLPDPTKPMKTTRMMNGGNWQFGTRSIGEIMMGVHNVNSAEHVGELQDVSFTNLLSGFLSSGAGKGKFGRKGGPIGVSGANYDLIVPDDVKELAAAYAKKFPHPETAMDDEEIKGGKTSTAEGGGPAGLSGGNNEDQIWNWLVGHGMSHPGAAGIMGNLQAESGFNPGAQEKGGTGIGIAQWSFGRADNLRNAAPGGNWQDLEFQLNFLKDEATSRGDWQSVSGQPTPRAAAIDWHAKFERSADSASKIGARGDNAERIFSAHGG